MIIVALILFAIFVLFFVKSNNVRRKSNNTGTDKSSEHTPPSIEQKNSTGLNIIEVTSETIAPQAPTIEHRIPKHEYVEYLMDQKGVKFLVHFTPVDNLEKILREGIIPRSCQEDKGVWTDSQRLDNMLDCNCLSISFPNYQMFYKKRQDMRNDFAVILIDPFCLNLFSKKDLYFLPHNAASVLFRNSPDKFTGQAALSNMFCRSITVDNRQIIRDNLSIPSYFTTSPQAELLVRGTIPPTFFREIHITNRDIFDDVRRISSQSLAKVFCSDEYFRARSDYRNWRK